jgi:hypothetical protein
LHETYKRLGERLDAFMGRVDTLVSAIGSLIASGKRPEGF